MEGERFVPEEYRLSHPEEFLASPEESHEQAEKSPEQLEKPKKTQLSRRHFLGVSLRTAVAFGVASSSMESLAVAQPAEQAEQTEKRDPEVEKSIRESWKEFKDTIKNEKVEESIAYIRKELGESGDELTYKARFDLLTFNTLAKAEQEGKDIYNDPDLRALLIQTINDYDLLWNRKFLRSRGERNEGQIQYEGFEAVPEIDLPTLKAGLEKQYGKAWLNGTVDKIVYVNQPESNKTFRLAGSAAGRELTSAIVKGEGQIIYIYKSDQLELADVKRTISHELGHHNDWVGSHNLTLPERLEFVRDVLGRRGDSDASQYDYVDKMIPEEGKAQGWREDQTKKIQVTEYWAMICEDYFSSPGFLLKTSPKDFALVQKWYSRINGK